MNIREKVALSPDDTVDRLAGCTADSADRERLWDLLGVTIVTFRDSLAVVSGRAYPVGETQTIWTGGAPF